MRGGHIGFYIGRDQRRKGYGKEALRLALMELRSFGGRRALLTVDSDNIASIKVIEANGAQLGTTGTDPETGKEFWRYWVDL